MFCKTLYLVAAWRSRYPGPVTGLQRNRIGCPDRSDLASVEVDVDKFDGAITFDVIKVEGEGEWHARKHGGPKRRVWRKIHLEIDEETLEVRAMEITGSHIAGAPVLPDLLKQIPAHEQIGSVTADGAYDTRECHDAIADRGPHAVIPPRKNAKPWKTVTAGAVARNEALRASKYLGRELLPVTCTVSGII